MLTKRKQELEVNVKWHESLAAELREEAADKIANAQDREKIAKADREEVAQCERALKALENQDRLSELETFHDTVGETISRWRSLEIGLDECQAAIIRAHDQVGVG